MEYEYQLKDGKISFEDGVTQLKQKYPNKIHEGAINNIEPDCITHLCSEIQQTGISFKDYSINPQDYNQYVRDAQYTAKYPGYYTDNFFEKSLEHYLCYRLLNLKKDDTFVDIASEHSPVGEIFSRLTGCNSYSQDIMYEKGMHGHRIGGNASDIPVPDNFFKAAIATCSIEHFENNSDIEFMNEMERVLDTGGKCIIVPLYLYIRPSCQTDPQYSIPGNVVFDNNEEIYCAKGWGNRHGRFYSVGTLIERLTRPNKKMKFEIYLLKNPEMIDHSVYCRFLLMGEKI